MVENLFRSELKNFKPYNVDDNIYDINLDSNESFITFSDKLKYEISKTVENSLFNRYPDPRAEEVCKLYSSYSKVSSKNIIAGNGSDELIQIIMNSFVDKGDKVAVLDPDFSMYNFSTSISGGRIVKIPLDENFNVDVDDLIEIINKQKVKVFIFSNPNNPTGSIIKKDDIIKIVSSCSCIVVVDEAYYEFYGETMADKIDYYDNLIILRTCSKAMGLAAIRLGFLISNEKTIDEIMKIKPPFNVNSITQSIGSVILNKPEIIKDNIKKIKTERDYLFNELNKINKIKTYKTHANYILIKVGDGGFVYNKLLDKSIKVRKFESARLKNHLRITVGSRDENINLLKSLNKII